MRKELAKQFVAESKNINEVRLAVLCEALSVLASVSPTKNTFHDTYDHALDNLFEITKALRKDIYNT